MKKLYLFVCIVLFAMHSFAVEPTTPSSNLTLGNVQGNSLYVYLTQGDGAYRMAVLKLGSPVTAVPQNGLSYNANSTFGSGQQIAPDEYVVYSGTAGSFFVNGLVAETEYYIAVYEFNGTSYNTEYLTSSFLSDTVTTLFAPEVQTTSLQISNINGNTMDVSWTRGDGNATIVLCKSGSPVDANPVELISYRSNAAMHYRGINEASIIGNGNFVVYKGSGSSFTITNLYPDSTYYFAAFEYNGSTGPVYLTTNPARGDAATLSHPTIASTNLQTTGSIEGNQLQLSWTPGNGTRRIVVAREGAPVNALPQNNTDYNESTYFDQADSIAPGQKVVYDNAYNNCYIRNLKPGATYYFAVFEYSGSGNKIGYLTSEYPTHSESTQPVPSLNVSNIDTTIVSAYFVQFKFTPGNGMGRIVVMKEGAPVDYVPTQFAGISSWNSTFGSAYGSVGNGNYVVYKGTDSTCFAGFSPNKTYHAAAFEFNGTNYPVYAITNVDTFSFTTKLPPAPTIPSRTLNFSSIEGNSMRLVWTNGDGDRRIIIARKDSAVTAIPTNGVQYTANKAFNLAPELAPGQKVVYDGTGYYADIDSLEIGTTYFFEVIEYNGSGNISNYLLSETLRGGRSTASAPTVSASNIHFELITLDKLRIYWTRGNGGRRLILARANAPVDGIPENLKVYNASSYFGSGAKIGESNTIFSYTYSGTDGNNQDTVYTEITRVDPGNTYHFAIFEYNGIQAPVYKQVNPGVDSFTVTFEPPAPATDFRVNTTDGNQLGLMWTKGAGDNRVIIAREGQPVDVVPQDGVDYAANEDFRLAPEISPGQKVIYDGASYFAYAKGLNPNTQYFFKIFEYGGTGTEIDYLTSASDSTDGWTYGPPTIQASNLVVSGITPESGNVSWTNGDGQRRMVVARKGSPVSAEPNDTTSYTWNQYFGRGSHLGDQNYVVYKGTANNFTMLQLESGTTYHLSVYEYNGNVGPVLLRPPLTGKFTTLGPPQENAQVLDATLITKNSFQINFVPGSGQKRIIVMREGSPVDADPVDDINYIENTYLGAGDTIGSGNFVVYDGEDDNIIVTGLTANKTYYFSIFEYNAFNGGTIVNYLIPTTATGSVTTLPDNIPPVLDSIADKTVNEFEELAFTVTASDDDFPPQQITYSLDNASLALGMTIDPNSGVFSWIPGEIHGNANYPVTVTATDDGNNPDTLSDSVSFSISVIETNSSPSLDLVADQFIDYDSTLTLSFTASDTDIPLQTLTFSINQSSLDEGMTLNSSTGEFSFTPVAAQSGLIYSVELSVTDNGTNPSDLSDTVDFKIAVLRDTLAPVIGTVTNLLVDNDPGQCGALVEIIAPSVTDNRDEITTLGIRNDGFALSSAYPVGETLIFWTSEDNSGNKADTITQKVTVIDTSKPVIVNLPADISVSNDAGLCSAVVSWTEPQATDNCGTPSLTSNYSSGDAFPVGTTTVIYTTEDIHGNTQVDSFKVTVKDTEQPVPDLTALPLLSANCRITAWTAPTASDNCGGQITGIPDLLLPIDYDTTVTWTFTDAYGNRSYQTQEIKILVGVSTWYADIDGDDYGAFGTDSLSCETPVGYVSNDLDCDDSDSSMNPADLDGDGVSSCDGDCDDTDPNVFPGNTEVCDGIDNNCDGQVDEGVGSVWYADLDRDGFGDSNVTQISCDQPSGYVSDNTDCNDSDGTVYPGATELCDGIDNDCDGEIDEEIQTTTWFADVDGDGFGDAVMDSVSCSQPEGYVDIAGDNCPDTYNPDQLDSDGDNIGDVCDETPVIVDCQLGSWSQWSECSADCGTGIQCRTREILQYPSNGGILCGDTIEYRECNLGECAVDCQLGEWSGWSECSADCGTGIQYRTREVLQYPSNGGILCGDTIEYRECNLGECDVDCQLGEWSAWSECSADCGTGVQYRTREVLQYPFNSGILCGDTIEYRECIIQPCEKSCPDSISILSIITPIDPNPVNTTIEANAVIDAIFAEVVWNWGDGYSTNGTATSESLSESHTYTGAGVYRIELIVTDTCGNTDTAVSDYIPVYDPNGGFVTGGGWIWSPAGAYIADSTLEGKANFGFVAKYKKGSNIPEGHTEFHFNAGNLNFNSSSYDAMRLIISGAKAQFKGVGTINGSGNYGFMISVLDGALSGSSDQDKFRIKIWDLDNYGAIVYDNNIEQTDENAEPATIISSGSIIIHKQKGNKSAEIERTVFVQDASANLNVWPNPFNKQLNFRFSYPEITRAKLEIYDMTGSKVVTLFDDYLDANQLIDLKYIPTNIISGFYLYRLQLGDVILTDRIVYSKY